MIFNIVGNEFGKFTKYWDVYDEVVDSLSNGFNDANVAVEASKKAFAQSGLTKGVYEYINSLGVASAKEMTFLQKLKLSTIAIKEQAAAIWASPIGKAAIIAAGIFLVTKAIVYFTESASKSREKLAQLKEEYNENESNITSLNNELKTTRDRIEEIQSQGTISVTEREELDNLRKQSTEMERELALLKEIQKQKTKDLNLQFIDTMNRDYGDAKEYSIDHKYASSNYTPKKTATRTDTGNGSFANTMSEMDMLYSALMRREEIVQEIDELSADTTKKAQEEREKLKSLLNEIDSFLTSKSQELTNTAEGLSYIDNPTEEYEKNVNELLNSINDFNDKFMISLGSSGARMNAFNRLIYTGFSDTTKELRELGEQGLVTADDLNDEKYDSFIQKCIDLGVITDDGTESLEFLASAFNSVGTASGEAADGVSSTQKNLDAINEGIDDVQSRISSLSDALTKLQDGSLGVNDVIDLLQQFPELAPYVDLTAEGFGDLEKGLRDLIKASPDDLIETLKQFKETEDLTEEQAAQIDNLCEALGNLPTGAVKDVTGEFGLLAEQIKAATKAQTDLEKKLAEDDYDAGYEGRVEAFEGFKEVLNAGEYGSKAYAAYKEYFGLIEKTPAQIQEWMDANSKYFKEGTDGVLAFLQTVDNLSGSGGALDGIASFDSSTGEFWYDINALDDFADVLGWTEEQLQDFIYKYRMYCDEWTSRSAQDNLTEFTNAGIVFDVGDESFASLQKLIDYTGLSKDEILKLVDAMNELRDQQGLEPIQLIGSDQITITQETVDNLLDAGATAGEVLSLLDRLRGQDGVTIENGVQIVVSADSDDAEAQIDTVNTMLDGIPPETTITINDDTSDARSKLSSVINYLSIIDKNKYKTITITYREGTPIVTHAAGTKKAEQGPSLLGDEYSPDGSPKPELVVSDGRAYLAGQNGPEIGYLNEGDVVYNADETKKILRGNTIHNSIQANGGGTANGLKDIGAIGDNGGYKYSNISSGSDSKSDDEEETWFERLYKHHQHLLEMDQENVSDYLEWLDEAYQKAYAEGIIELDDFYKYQEEVYTGLQDLFKDYLNDVEHEISMRENYDGEERKIIQLYEGLIDAVEKEISAARSRGLTDEDDYIQDLQSKWQDYTSSITDLRDKIIDASKDAVEKLIDFRIDMLKKDIENEKDAISEKLSNLKDFYQRQKELLQDVYDEEEYLEQQSEKRRAVSDIQEELARLEYDNSAWAQKKKLELEEELADAKKELNDFEKDHALQTTQDLLDKQLEMQEEKLNAETDALDEQLGNAKALYEQALEDIRNGSVALYEEMLEYNSVYGSGIDEDITQMWESAYTALQKYFNLYNAHYKDITLANATNYSAPGKAWDTERISGTNPNSNPSSSSGSGNKSSSNEGASDGASASPPPLTKGSSITVKETATHFSAKSGNLRMKSFVPGGTYTVYQESGDEVLIGLNGAYTGWINKSDIVGYASGTSNATAGLHRVDELGTEYIFESPSDGTRYRLFRGGEKVLNAEATNFLYDFATTGGSVLTKMLSNILGVSSFGNISRPVQAIDIHAGDIIVQGSASERTVSEIRRAQRENLEFVLKSLNALNK